MSINRNSFLSTHGSQWRSYYDRTSRITKPHSILTKALNSFEKEEVLPGIAFDLGCGSGRDTSLLVKKGWKVIAIDNEFLAEDYLKKRIPNNLQDSFIFVPSRFEDFNFPSNIQLINAIDALPFCSPSKFDTLMGSLATAIMPGGRFVGNFLGSKDHEVQKRALVSVTSKKLIQYFGDAFEIELFKEVRKNEKSRHQLKYRHVYQVIARKLTMQEIATRINEQKKFKQLWNRIKATPLWSICTFRRRR